MVGKRGTRVLTLDINDKFLSKSKRSQVTIFIIIGIVIVAAVVLVFAFWKDFPFLNKEETDIAALSREAIYVKNYVDNCLQESLRTTIFINALQGGYYKAPIEIKNKDEGYNSSTYVHYYLANGKNFIPTENTLSNQISLGIYDQFKDCLTKSNFLYDVNYYLDEIAIESLIDDEKIKSKVYLPTLVHVGDSSSKIENFETEINTEFLRFYRLSKEITEEQISHLDNICISCFEDFSKRYGVSITTTELYDGDDFIIIYNLEKFLYVEDPVLVYSFAHKLNIEENEK